MTHLIPKLRKLQYFDVDTEEEVALNQDSLHLHPHPHLDLPSDDFHLLSEEDMHIIQETPSTPRNHPSSSYSSHSPRHHSEYSGSSYKSHKLSLVPIKPKPTEKNNTEISNKSSGSLSSKSSKSVSYVSELQSSRNSRAVSLVESSTPQPSNYETNRSFKTQTSVDSTKNNSTRRRLEIPKNYADEEQIHPKELSGMHVMFTSEEIKDAFESFDMDKNGFISAEEIRIIMETIGEYVTDEEIDEMIRMLDYEGKGQVGYAEFFKMSTGQTLGPIGAALPPSPMMVNTQSNRSTVRTHGTIKITESGKGSTKSRVSKESISEDLEPRRRSLESDRLSKVSETSSKKAIEKKKLTQMKPPPSPESNKSTEQIYKPKIVDRKPGFKPPKHTLRIEFASRPGNTVIKEENNTKLRPLKDVANKQDLSHISASNEWRNSTPDSEDLGSICLISQSVPEDQLINSIITDLVKTTSFTPQTIERLKNVFNSVAGGETEAMSYEMFLNLVNSKLASDRKLDDDRVTRRLFAVIDTDSDGLLNLHDFVKGLFLITRSNKEEQFKLVFRVFDTDEDGAISQHELTRILKLNTATIKSDEQAMKKAHEILRLAGSSDLLTLEAFMSLKEKPLMLLAPLQERASKIGKLII